MYVLSLYGYITSVIRKVVRHNMENKLIEKQVVFCWGKTKTNQQKLTAYICGCLVMTNAIAIWVELNE